MEDKLKKMQLRVILIILLLILALGMGLTGLMLNRAEQSEISSTQALVATNNEQLGISISNYFQDVEQTAALMFSDDSIYQFDPTAEDIDRYSLIQRENAIRNRIIDIALMKNFSDFGVVFSDDTDAGWISQVTGSMFPDGGIYETFSAYAVNPKTEDGWAFGIKGSRDRLWYVKRLNPGAVLVVSFYAEELKNAFDYPESLQGMSVRLIDQDDRILYSSQSDEIGGSLDSETGELLRTSASVSRVIDDRITVSSTCGNGWRVVSSYPLQGIRRHSHETGIILTLVALVISVSFMIVVLILWRQMTMPVNSMVRTLNEQASRDQLSGLLNKITYESLVSNRIAETGSYSDGTEEGSLCVYMLMDIDNFKQVNDTLGHDRGDEVITICGSALLDSFGKEAMVGRVGGDEFSAFRVCKGMEEEEIRTRVLENAVMFRRLLKEGVSGPSWKNVPVTASMGIVMFSGRRDFLEVYRAADRTLYDVKNHGKKNVKIVNLDREAAYAKKEEQ